MVAPTGQLDERLKTWASETQCRYIDAVNEHGSLRAAARALGLNYTTVNGAIRAAKGRASLKGWSPEHDMTKTVPEAFVVRGTSTLYDEAGKAKLQWVKTRLDDEKAGEVVRAAIAALSEDVRALAPLTPAPERVHDDLLCVIPIGDCHIGMYAWAKETGDAFDLDIARKLTTGAIDRLMQAAPPSKTCIILPLGDVFHADDQTNQTPAHRHQLDVDSRYVKVLGVGIEAFRHVILRALQKHERVIVRFVAGNHDPHSIWALAFTISAYFANEPRVEVDLSPSKFWFFRFGQVLIGSTHGDTVKHDALLGVMAADRAQDWGQTSRRYWYTGHVHHQSVREYPGVVCESFRTLAAKDAYAAGHGYRAGRDMVAIVHHREHGEIERHRVDIGMLEPA
ncbi:LysR family transcriptional regulator [Methylibium sp.]|uniref:helix-turn-helix domain-containing protein n=1 Tax=Methylibium sp. TaxID=2067992 RepID=UPI0017BE68AB|nr:LysR family transcriptional regulator [Methylibium sp.]MBA3588220.1 LysR family transcriptional regulator [Methylibium sp.]